MHFKLSQMRGNVSFEKFYKVFEQISTAILKRNVGVQTNSPLGTPLQE